MLKGAAAKHVVGSDLGFKFEDFISNGSHD